MTIPDVKYRDIEIRGTVYPTVRDAAEALSISTSAVYHAIWTGTLHRCGTGRVGTEPMPVRIAGLDFESAHAAAAHFGCAVGTIWSAICDGDPDRVARPQRYNPARAQPIEIGGLSFSSMRVASTALGFSNPEYIAKVIKAGSKLGMQRVLAAAMKEAARREGQANVR